MRKYEQINLRELKKYFLIDIHNDLYRLRYKNNRSNSIYIKIPFELNEDVAKLVGLTPDGSLIKDLMRIYFSQKKDVNKLFLFKELIIKLFSPESTMLFKKEMDEIYINSQVLARFYYHILEIPKSDEPMRVPKWIFDSPKSVKQAYLREVFAMEGTILKNLAEIRLITQDKDFAYDLQRLLETLTISSTVNPRIGGIRKVPQSRLSIFRKENFSKFKEIGFSYPIHIKRFNKMIEKYNV